MFRRQLSVAKSISFLPYKMKILKRFGMVPWIFPIIETGREERSPLPLNMSRISSFSLTSRKKDKRSYESRSQGRCITGRLKASNNLAKPNLKKNPEFIAAINLTCHPMKIIKIVTPIHYGLPNS